MRSFLIASMIAGLAPFTAVIAAEQSPTTPVPPEQTQTIKVSTAFDLLTALNMVTGTHDEVVGQGASQRTIAAPYDLNADTLWALTDDITVIRKFVNTVQDINKSLIGSAEAKNGGVPLQPKTPAVLDAAGNVVTAAVPSDAQLALQKEQNDLYASDRPIDKLFHIKRGDLKNAMSGPDHIPGSVISSLSPILDP
jgi:hypothetical protein